MKLQLITTMPRSQAAPRKVVPLVGVVGDGGRVTFTRPKPKP